MSENYRCNRHEEDGPYETDDFQHYWLHMKDCHGIDVYDKKKDIKKPEINKTTKVRPGETIEVIFRVPDSKKEYTKPYKVVHETSGKMTLKRIYKAVSG